MSDSNITKNALAASMKKMMRRRPFEKISVSDICMDCGINRKSFYYHFRDKYDLVNWIFFVGFLGEMDLTRYQNGWDWVRDICEYFYREKEFYRAALKIEGQNSFRDYLVETIEPIIRFFVRDMLPSDEDVGFYLTFLCDAFLTALVRWLSGGYDQEMDADGFLRRIRQLMGSMSGFADETDQRNSE